MCLGSISSGSAECCSDWQGCGRVPETCTVVAQEERVSQVNTGPAANMEDKPGKLSAPTTASDGIPRKCCHLDLLTKFHGLNFTPEAPPKPGLGQRHNGVDLSSKSSSGFIERRPIPVDKQFPSEDTAYLYRLQ